jgi:hypothetical protein
MYPYPVSLDAKIQKTGDCGRFFPENVENKNRRLRENNPAVDLNSMEPLIARMAFPFIEVLLSAAGVLW